MKQNSKVEDPKWHLLLKGVKRQVQNQFLIAKQEPPKRHDEDSTASAPCSPCSTRVILARPLLRICPGACAYVVVKETVSEFSSLRYSKNKYHPPIL